MDPLATTSGSSYSPPLEGMKPRKVRRSEIVGSEWTIPGARYKTGKDHFVPLSQAAQAVLAKLPSEGFLFSTDGGETPISGFSKFKRGL